MKTKLLIAQCVLLSFVLGRSAHAESPDGFWRDASPKSETMAKAATKAAPSFFYRSQVADLEQLEAFLSGAPEEGAATGLPFYFPSPDGGYLKLEVFRSPIMARELEEKFPSLKTYKVYGAEGVDVTGRLGFSADGVYALLHTENGLVSLEPEALFVDSESVSDYRVFYKKDGPSSLNVIPGYNARAVDYEMIFDQNRQAELKIAQRISSAKSHGDELRVFRLAMAMTGELTQALGGTKDDGMAFVVKAVNLLNQIYEQELAIQLQLIANNDLLIYTDPNTDPFTVNNIRSENVSNTNNVIGPDNYDIGHVLSNEGGGVAIVRGVCLRDYKASATSGFNNGLYYWEITAVGVLAHEVGHQFGAMHTQNANCFRSDTASWEPHSGSTIMSYAGVCEPNLQNRSDAMFHAGSRQQIFDFLDGASCGAVKNTGHTPPTVDAGPDYTIPAGTPFLLTASSDSNQTLTYTWDQMDLGEQTTSNETTWFDHGNGPLFRSFAPSAEPTRLFPQASAILADDLSRSFGEILPTTDRTLNFRLTARSSQGLAQDDVELTVDADSGPFKITAPTSNQLSAGSTIDVRWDVANTNQPPINCAQVDIDLSNDNGLSFGTSLVKKTANDGSAQVTLPATLQSKVRLRVKCSDNIFFAVSRFEPVEGEPGTGKIFLITGLEADNNRFIEGNDGVTELPFIIRREYANESMSVEYSMFVNGEYSEMQPADGEDFVGGRFSGVVTLLPGELEATVMLNVNADQVLEGDEYFFILLSDASSGTLSTNYALMTILNDDVAAESQEEDAQVDTVGSGTRVSRGGAFVFSLLLPLLLIRRRRTL